MKKFFKNMPKKRKAAIAVVVVTAVATALVFGTLLLATGVA